MCHELMSAGSVGGAEESQRKASQLHTFNSEFNISDPGGHAGFASLADETVPNPQYINILLSHL